MKTPTKAHKPKPELLNSQFTFRRNKKTKIPAQSELLAPAGSLSALTAAIKAGADAVYLGLKQLNMRATGKNFSLNQLKQASKICKQNKVKLYLTLNTIIYDKELKKVESIVKKAKPFVDAIICWDLSVVQLCRKYKVPFHISTQASVSNSQSAEFYKKLGAERIILARELNLKQIKQISKIIPIEIFIHGALCVSVSGRCFTSQFLHNQSANRGRCTHPCRRQYQITDLTDKSNQLILQNNRVMSAKDLCCIEVFEKLKKANITSFKIEGRNRNPEYVYTVTSIYRKALDKKLTKPEINKALEQLKEVYNRGFSQGFLLKSPTSDDFSTSEHGEQKQKKKFIGKIIKYWPKLKVAHIKISNSGLKTASPVYIIGKSTFLKTKVKSIEINHKKVEMAKKATDVGIKFTDGKKMRKGDEVYLIEEKK